MRRNWSCTTQLAGFSVCTHSHNTSGSVRIFTLRLRHYGVPEKISTRTRCLVRDSLVSIVIQCTCITRIRYNNTGENTTIRWTFRGATLIPVDMSEHGIINGHTGSNSSSGGRNKNGWEKVFFFFFTNVRIHKKTTKDFRRYDFLEYTLAQTRWSASITKTWHVVWARAKNTVRSPFIPLFPTSAPCRNSKTYTLLYRGKPRGGGGYSLYTL